MDLVFGLVLLACSKKCVDVSLECSHIRNFLLLSSGLVYTRLYSVCRNE